MPDHEDLITLHTVRDVPVKCELHRELPAAPGAGRLARTEVRSRATVLGWSGDVELAAAFAGDLARSARSAVSGIAGERIRLRLAVLDDETLIIDVSDSSNCPVGSLPRAKQNPQVAGVFHYHLAGGGRTVRVRLHGGTAS